MADIFDSITGFLGSRPNKSRTFSVDSFVANVNKSGMSKAAHFAVIIGKPKHLDYRGYDVHDLVFRCDQASLPARSILSLNQNYSAGPERLIPYRFAKSLPITLTITLSEDLREREFFERWQDLAVGKSREYGAALPPAPWDASYYMDYMDEAGLEIWMYGESPAFQGVAAKGGLFQDVSEIARAAGFDPSVVTNPFGLDPFGSSQAAEISPIMKIRFMEPFPNQINEVQLNWGDDSVNKLNVEFNYRYATVHLAKMMPTTSTSIATMMRKGIEALNRFSPVFSLIKGQGLGGGTRALFEQAGSGVVNAGVAQRSVLPF